MYNQYADEQVNSFERSQREQQAAKQRVVAELSRPEALVHTAIAAFAIWLGAQATMAVRTLGRIAEVRALL